MNARQLTLLCVLALSGCGAAAATPTGRPTVVRSSAGLAGVPSSQAAVERSCRRFVAAYLRAEVGQARPGDIALLRAAATPAVGAQVSPPARAPLAGFPPRGRVVALTVLPVVVAGRWVVQARLDRAGRPAFLEVQLVSSARGPLVDYFTSTTGAA